MFQEAFISEAFYIKKGPEYHKYSDPSTKIIISFKTSHKP